MRSLFGEYGRAIAGRDVGQAIAAWEVRSLLGILGEKSPVKIETTLKLQEK
ncbi:MAG: hypothetical protein VKJ46_12710 [Leptolyngbyaceae bacterium]|nr:hypothetical protein [Leptolyngbyaceae bacterium]